MKAYEEDLAYIHDVAFSAAAIEAAPGLLEIFRQGGVTSGLVVDLGCGTGQWIEKLIGAGYDALGIDISAAVIKRARERAPQASFAVGSFLKVELPPCDAVTSIGVSLSYLLDEDHGKPALTGLFERVYAALRPGGLFVFDLSELKPAPKNAPPPRTWVEGEDWSLLINIEKDQEKKQATLHMVTYRKLGEHYRRSEERHPVQLYKSAEVAAELRRAGFRVRPVRQYAQHRLRAAQIGFIARKP